MIIGTSVWSRDNHGDGEINSKIRGLKKRRANKSSCAKQCESGSGRLCQCLLLIDDGFDGLEVPAALLILATPPPLSPPWLNETPSARQDNISRSGERIYHLPDMADYKRARISEGNRERWLVSDDEVRAAGRRRAAR